MIGTPPVALPYLLCGVIFGNLKPQLELECLCEEHVKIYSQPLKTSSVGI